ncbi:MAG: TonB-dependent receptor plug domain-containing protein [Ignavibacteriaceae bacterium]
MKLILIYSFVLVLSGLLFGQDGHIVNNDPSVQIITEETLKSSGISTISEILFLADNLNISTIDGTTNFFSVNNLSPYQRQNILVLIDGQKADMSIFDVQNLKLIPLSINQIDYVEIITTPRIINGNFASSGAIHFHTKVPSQGLSFQGAFTMGDETGDPGPFTFTEFETPNVDKLAQYYSLTVNSAGKNWFMNGSIKYEENFKTDPALNERLSFLNNDDNKERLTAYLYKINGNILNGTQQFVAGYSSNQDFFFFNPYANEIPVKQEFRHFGFNGDSKIKNFGIRYSISQNENKLGYLINNNDINFDFGTKSLSLNLEAFLRAKIIKTSVGLGLNKYTALSSAEFTDNNLEFRNFYGTIDFYPADRFYQSAAVFVTRYYQDISYKGYLTTGWLLTQHHSLFTNFSLIQNLFPEDNNFWVWENRGYRFNSQQVNYTIPPAFNTKEIFTGDFIYKYRIDSLSSFEIGANFRSFSNYYLEKQFYQFNSQNSTFTSVTDISPDEHLKTAGTFAGINLKLTSKLFSKIRYSYSKYIEGSTLFKETWDNFPEHTIMLNFNYQPFQNAGISARLKYYSKTVWYNYKYSSYQSDDKYNMEIKPWLSADLSANLWMWDRRIWLNALLKNILSNPEKYHPIGADLDMRFFLQVHFYLNSLLE